VEVEEDRPLGEIAIFLLIPFYYYLKNLQELVDSLEVVVYFLLVLVEVGVVDRLPFDLEEDVKVHYRDSLEVEGEDHLRHSLLVEVEDDLDPEVAYYFLREEVEVFLQLEKNELVKVSMIHLIAKVGALMIF